MNFSSSIRYWISAFLTLTVWLSFETAVAQLPREPISIQAGVPQFLHDDELVDNHWTLKTKTEAVSRVFHHPTRHDSNPLDFPGTDKPGYLSVIRDTDESGKEIYRMYYQANYLVPESPAKGAAYRTDIAYAESEDGIHWTKPDLNLFPEKSKWAKPNNIVIGLPDRPNAESNGPMLLQNIPEKDKKGYRHILLYRVSGRGNGDIAGIHLIGSHDGIHFDPESDHHIAHLHSDTSNAICYAPEAGHYQLFCRAKQMYRAFGDTMIDTGASRRIASMTNTELWTDWLAKGTPQTLLVPDEVDAEKRFLYFYGMPTVHRYGLYWGFLQNFRLNDLIHTELTTSRDGEHWLRLHQRPALIEYGEEGTWDDNMIFASPSWIETGNEWRFYYNGWDGPHGGSERDSAIGLATCLRERLYSRRGPNGGGVVCTRQIIWPGGDLWINAGAVPEKDSEISIRISDSRRKVRDGFDHADCRIVGLKDDPTRQYVSWEGGTLAPLKGETIRIEFYLKNADLFSFGASEAN